MWQCESPDYSITELLCSHTDEYHIFEGKVIETNIRGIRYESKVYVTKSYNADLKDTIFIYTGGVDYGSGRMIYENSEWLFFATATDYKNYYSAISCDNYSSYIKNDKLKVKNYSVDDDRSKDYRIFTKQFYKIKNEKYTGSFDFIDLKGNIIARGNFTNGLANGKWYHYYYGYDRFLKSIRNYSNGKLHKESRKYALGKDTIILYEEEYDNGYKMHEKYVIKNVSRWYEYRNSDRLMRYLKKNELGDTITYYQNITFDYLNDKYENITCYSGYYYNIDTLNKFSEIAEGNYERGYKTGAWKYFSLPLKIDSTIHYKEVIPKEIGSETQIGKHRIIGQYNHNNRIGMWRYYYEKNLIRTEIYDETTGNMLLKTEYHHKSPFGIKKITKFKDDKKHGVEIEYYLNGIYKQYLNWDNGLRNGRSIEYTDSGKVINEYVYIDNRRWSVDTMGLGVKFIDGLKFGKETIIHKIGVREEGEYFRGYKIDKWKITSENGS